MLQITRNSFLEGHQILPHLLDEGFTEHRRATQLNKWRAQQALMGCVHLIQWLAKHKGPGLGANTPASMGFVSVTLLPSYLNYDTDWRQKYPEWWQEVVDHVPPGRPDKKGSQMLVAKRSSACLVLNHNFSADQRHPTSVSNPFIEAPWTPRLVACVLLQHAGDIATLSFRTGTGQLFAAPAGARDTGVVIDRRVALPWSEWLFPPMAPCHPIEQHLQDPVHWDSLWNYNTPDNMSPIYQSNVRSVHASHSWKTPKLTN